MADQVDELRKRQTEIVARFGVRPVTQPAEEVERRVAFLADYLLNHTNACGFVLGISGGQDSFNAGRLGQLAVEFLRKHHPLRGWINIAMRLPYGTQSDEADAMASVNAIAPDRLIVYDIRAEVDAAARQYEEATGQKLPDYFKGNRKARMRMAAQYDVAGANGCLVIGTDHAAEAIMGFYTKWGDGASDITPLSTLNKRQGRALARYLGAPPILTTKPPTADLEEDRPSLPDETALGLTYDQIDDFLEGKPVEPEIARRIIAIYDRTEHKRAAIPGC